MRTKLPTTHIAYISIAGNPARWSHIDRVREANRLIREWSRDQARVSFIDVYPHMMGSDGLPKPDIFLPDRLHMNEKGYAIWKRVVGEHLKSMTQTRGEAAP